MPANALVQTRIDPSVKERAAAVLEKQGITVSDAVRILLTRTANEGAASVYTSEQCRRARCVVSCQGAGSAQ